MAYDIYNTDILHGENESSDNSKKSPKKSPKTPFDLSNGLIVNIALILLLILIIGIFYFGDFSLSDEKTSKEIIINGDLSSFNKNLSGNISIQTGDYELLLSTGTFSGNNEVFVLTDFNGTIDYINKTFFLVGIVNEVEFGRNNLNVENMPIELRIKNKAVLQTTFDELELEFESGKFRVAEDLSYSMKDSIVNFKDINLNLNYDGKFSILATSKSFILENTDPKITIYYEE